MVYVLGVDGQPLMPTKEARARRFLKKGKAKVVRMYPFTVQLTYQSELNVQPTSLGVDPGSKTIGLSVTTERRVLLEAKVELRTDVSKLIAGRRAARRTRRSRLHHRSARFNNRVRPDGWLPPSIIQKLQTHLSAINLIRKILPIDKVVVEVPKFDVQRMAHPELVKRRQDGPQKGFKNVKQYVRRRDACCVVCGATLNLKAHHIESRKTGGNAPSNLVLLCKSCHRRHHAGELDVKFTRGQSLRDATFMNLLRWQLVEELRDQGLMVEETTGRETAEVRNKWGLEKDHHVDARCVSGHPLAVPDVRIHVFRKVRRHNRRLFKDKLLKGGRPKRHQGPRVVHGFQRFDMVRFNNRLWFINSLRERGRFQLKSLIANDVVEKSWRSLRRVAGRSGFVGGVIKIFNDQGAYEYVL